VASQAGSQVGEEEGREVGEGVSTTPPVVAGSLAEVGGGHTRTSEEGIETSFPTSSRSLSMPTNAFILFMKSSAFTLTSFYGTSINPIE